MYKLNMTRRAIGAAAVVLFFAAAAQGATACRIRGQIEKIDGDVHVVKTREGAMLNVKLADDAGVSAGESFTCRHLERQLHRHRRHA